MKKVNLLLIGIITLLTTSCYDFNRDQAEKDAESLEIKAKATAKKKIIEAEARAKSLEVEAKKEAEAIKVILKELENNPSYLKYKQVEALKGSKSIFVPTEGNMPILMQNN